MRATAVLLGLAGCVAPPRFVPVDFSLTEDLSAADWAELAPQGAAGLQRDLARGRLVEIEAQGRPLAPDELAALPGEVAYGAFALSARPRPQQHIDLSLPLVVDGAALRPVTLRIEDRVLSIAWADARPAPGPDASASPLAREAVARRFRLAAVADGTARWSAREVRLLDEALASVEPEVMALLHQMTFVRDTVSPRAPGRELAWFDPRTEPPTIAVYDLAFAPVSGTVGPLDAPHSLAVMTLVHEIGHVIADAPLRKAWLRVVAEPDNPDARQQLRSLGRAGPVIEAWREVRDHRAPTSYGARDAHESFAEAYALHRLDPEALDEIMPAGAAWFAQGGHLRATTETD